VHLIITEYIIYSKCWKCRSQISW